MTSATKILIIEDEEDIIELVTFTLTREGFAIEGLTNGDNLLENVIQRKPDLIILDLMLPGQNGYDLCKQLKQSPETSHIPVLILSAKSEESDIVVGLELGADDFITKPFSPKVLTARVRMILRRKGVIEKPETQDILVIGDLVVDSKSHSATLSGQPLSLTNSEFRALYFLAQKPSWVFSRYQIVEAIRPENYVVTDRAIDVLIVGLRKKMAHYGHYIETVRGVGYRFKDYVSQ